MGTKDVDKLAKGFSGLVMEPLPSNSHLKDIGEYFGEGQFGHTTFEGDTKYIFICFTNRSGSNYLAELLSSGGQFNVADECLNARRVIGISKKKGIKTFSDYFAGMVKANKRNGYFVAKTSITHLELLVRAKILDQIIGNSKFILIERSDKLSQAISHVLAFETERYTSLLSGVKDDESVEFSKQKISEILRSIVKNYFHFDMFFAQNCIVPAHIIYEQLIKDPKNNIAHALDGIGLGKLDVFPELVRLSKQAGKKNQEWREQYLKSVYG